MAEKLTWFSCSYRFEGRTFSVLVEARNWAEVSTRLRAIGINGKVDGEHVAEFHAYPRPHVLRRISIMFNRCFRRANP